MEEHQKLYSQKAISIATFFGGPLAAGYLVKKNYQSLGQESHANKAFFIGIISTLLLLAGVFSIPENIIDKIPNALIPGIYTGIIYLIVEHLQGQNLKEHLEKGREFYSVWKAVGIGAISMTVLLLFIAITAFISADLSITEPDPEPVVHVNDFDSFFDQKETTGIKKNITLTFRENLKANEIGIKFPEEARVGDTIAVEIICRETLGPIKMLKSSIYDSKGTSSTSNVVYQNDEWSGTYTRKFYLSFNKKGNYEINESWFENIPENLKLRSEKIKVK